MTGTSANHFALAEAETLRAIYGRSAEDRCIEEYMELDQDDPRRDFLNRVLAFLNWTENRLTAPIAA
jgi:hypothetical protein